MPERGFEAARLATSAQNLQRAVNLESSGDAGLEEPSWNNGRYNPLNNAASFLKMQRPVQLAASRSVPALQASPSSRRPVAGIVTASGLRETAARLSPRVSSPLSS